MTPVFIFLLVHHGGMDLIAPVSQAIAILAMMLALGVGVAFIAVALARISMDFFKG